MGFARAQPIHELKRDAREAAIDDLHAELVEESFNAGTPAIGKIPIKMSTVQGSKGWQRTMYLSPILKINII
jgi:hypothetical protein